MALSPETLAVLDRIRHSSRVLSIYEMTARIIVQARVQTCIIAHMPPAG